MFKSKKPTPVEADSPFTDLDPGSPSIQEIQAEYRYCLQDILGRAGIASECVSLDVRHIATLPDGRPVLTGMLRLVSWERSSGLRLLLGLPMLERASRRLIGGSWVSMKSQFGGLWLHPSAQVMDKSLLIELGAALNTLESAAVQEGEEQGWSVRADLEPERKSTDWNNL